MKAPSHELSVYSCETELELIYDCRPITGPGFPIEPGKYLWASDPVGTRESWYAVMADLPAFHKEKDSRKHRFRPTDVGGWLPSI